MTEAEIDLDEVVAEIKVAVAEKTASGVYSPDLEHELASNFARLVGRSDERGSLQTLINAIEDLEEVRAIPLGPVVTASRIPGGQLVHRTAGWIVRRPMMLESQRSDRLWQSALLALRAVAVTLREPPESVGTGLVHELDTVQDRLAAVERTLGRSAELLAEMERTAARLHELTTSLDDLTRRVKALELASAPESAPRGPAAGGSV